MNDLQDHIETKEHKMNISNARDEKSNYLFCPKCNLFFNAGDIDTHAGHRLYIDNLAQIPSKSGLLDQDQIGENTKKSENMYLLLIYG